MNSAPVKTRCEGSVLVISIDRPEVRNAVDLATSEALAAAMDELDARDDVAVGVLTGSGGYFCAGMDLKAFLRGERPLVAGRGFGGLTEAPPRKPLIAAVEGVALAGGCELMLSCDLVVAAQDVKIGIPEVKRGLAAAAGGLLRLPQRLPFHVAMELALTGDPMDASRAYALGLINRVTPPGHALDEAVKLANSIAANAPLAVQVSKQVIVDSRDWPLDSAFEMSRVLTTPVLRSEDAREGARAFAEKRTPAWTGR